MSHYNPQPRSQAPSNLNSNKSPSRAVITSLSARVGARQVHSGTAYGLQARSQCSCSRSQCSMGTEPRVGNGIQRRWLIGAQHACAHCTMLSAGAQLHSQLIGPFIAQRRILHVRFFHVSLQVFLIGLCNLGNSMYIMQSCRQQTQTISYSQTNL